MKTKILLLSLVLVSLISCTGNQRAKRFGGTHTIELDSNQTLVTATWRGENLWYLVRQRTPNEKPQESSLKENSSFGLIQGEVIFKEK
jgi:hypothetical protein